MDNLPIDILKQIIKYEPNDIEMESPTNKFVYRLIDYYNDEVEIEDAMGLMYVARDDEPFYKYALRVNSYEYQILKHLNSPFCKGHLYFTLDDDFV